MKIKKTTIPCLLVPFLLIGCSSVGLDKGDYYGRLEGVELGMLKEDFKQMFPESIPQAAKLYSNGSVEVLEVSYEYYAFMPTGNRERNAWTGMEGQPQWFYFFNGTLRKFGDPGDWPTEPDLIIETRKR
jgi:hypothetical protein